MFVSHNQQYLLRSSQKQIEKNNRLEHYSWKQIEAGMLETMRGPQRNILIIWSFDPKHKQNYMGGGICLRKCIRVSQMNLDESGCHFQEQVGWRT